MPHYLYFCNNCNKYDKLYRNISDESEAICKQCSEKMSKQYSSFSIIQKNNIGDVTNKFIEESKEELKKHKSEIKR